MSTRNPALWENGQHLAEADPEHPDRYSKAARKAQATKWRRLMDNRPPVDALRLSLFARPGTKPPLYHYGLAFTEKYALDYARRHHLTIPLAIEDRERFGGRPELDLAELTDSLLEADEDVSFFATAVSHMLMIEHLSRRCRFTLEEGLPFTNAWDGVVALWSNYNAEEKFGWCDDHERVIEVLKEAMNETDDHKSLKAQWWFDWQNDVGVFTSVD